MRKIVRYSLTNKIQQTVMCLIIACFGISAQIVTSENSILSIAQNSIIATNESFTNNGTINNNGNITLSGDWENNGIYNEEQGTVVFNSQAIQRIYHNNQNFCNLEINGGEKYAEDNVTITGTLSLNQGIVTPSNNSIILLGENADILNYSASSYINGALYHAGTGDKQYPIGKNGNYCPVELLGIQGNNPVTGVEVFEPNPGPQPGPGIDLVSTERYWQKTILSGSYDGAWISINCAYSPVENFQNTVIAQSSAMGGVFSSIGNRNITDGIVPDFITSEAHFTDNIVSLAELGGLSIKNVITPNNDGVNDYLFIPNIDRYPDNEIIIINRSGNIVYSEKNYNNTWNAVVDNKTLPTGSYICILKLGGAERVYKQAITILR